MTEVDLISANLITEIQCGTGVNQAISEHRRADFALLLAMLSNDATETTPVDLTPSESADAESIRKLFSVPESQPLTSNSESYQNSARIADMFHSGGLNSAKLNHYLSPEALCFKPEATQGLPEDVYHNLSGHTVRRMKQKTSAEPLHQELYHQLVDAHRKDQLMAYA